MDGLNSVICPNCRFAAVGLLATLPEQCPMCGREFAGLKAAKAVREPADYDAQMREWAARNGVTPLRQWTVRLADADADREQAKREFDAVMPPLTEGVTPERVAFARWLLERRSREVEQLEAWFRL